MGKGEEVQKSASGNEKANNLPGGLKFREKNTVSILKLLSEERDKLNTCSDKEQGIRTIQQALLARAWPRPPPPASRVASSAG